MDPKLHRIAQRISRRLPIEFLHSDAENTEFKDCTHNLFCLLDRSSWTRKNVVQSSMLWESYRYDVLG
jgi:hypothetical protein